MNEIFCPCLGMKDGSDSHFGYPSHGNSCWRADEPALIDLDHQDRYCLKEAYTSCPIYLNPQTHTISDQEQFLRPVEHRPRLGLIFGLAALALVILIGITFGVLYLLDSGETLRSWFAQMPNPLQTQNVTSTPLRATETPSQVSAYPPPALGVQLTQTAQPAGEIQLDEQRAVVLGDSRQSGVDDPGREYLIARPDAYQLTIGGEAGLQLEPRINLPERESYNVVVDGQQLVLDPGPPASFTQSGPGFRIRVEGLLAETNSQESLRITPDGRTVWYQASEDNQIDVLIEYEGDGQKVYLALRGLDVYPGHPVSVNLDTTAGMVTVHNEGFLSGEYDLRLGLYKGETLSFFLRNAISSEALQRHDLDYSSLLHHSDQLAALSRLPLTITSLHDEGDSQVLTLKNQVQLIFVQMLIKQ